MTERPELRSVATQSNLLAAPPLQKLVRAVDAHMKLTLKRMSQMKLRLNP